MMEITRCNEKIDFKNPEFQSSKLKYATLLSSGLKGISDISLTGSKIIDSMLLSSHRYLFETYCAINKMSLNIEERAKELFLQIQWYAFNNKELDTVELLESLLFKDLSSEFTIRIYDKDYSQLLIDIHNLVIKFMRNKFKHIIKPKDNGDYELTQIQITKLLISGIRLFGTFAISLDRIYQHYKYGYGKPIILLNSSVVGKDRLKCLKKIIDIVSKTFDINELFIYIEEDLISKQELISCTVNDLIKDLEKNYPTITFKSLHI